MEKALVLINTDSALEVAKNMEKIVGVTEVYRSSGMYDLMVWIQGDSIENLKETLSSRIRTMEKVKGTLTLTLVEAASKPRGFFF